MYGWAIRRIDPEKVEEWVNGLDAPLPGETMKKEDPFPVGTPDAQAEAEGQAFMAAMQQFGSGF